MIDSSEQNPSGKDPRYNVYPPEARGIIELNLDNKTVSTLAHSSMYTGLYCKPHLVIVGGRWHIAFNYGDGRIVIGKPDPCLTPEAAAAEKMKIIEAVKASIISNNEF
jgi:hypothetical protein